MRICKHFNFDGVLARPGKVDGEQIGTLSPRLMAVDDMYDVLVLCLDWLVSTGADGSPLCAVESALKKARGEA